MLLEKISLASIARVIDVSEYWLQKYVNDIYDSTPKNINVTSKRKISNVMQRSGVALYAQFG